MIGKCLKSLFSPVDSWKWFIKVIFGAAGQNSFTTVSALIHFTAIIHLISLCKHTSTDQPPKQPWPAFVRWAILSALRVLEWGLREVGFHLPDVIRFHQLASDRLSEHVRLLFFDFRCCSAGRGWMQVFTAENCTVTRWFTCQWFKRHGWSL